MKITTFLLTTLMLACSISFGQTTKDDNKEMYPDKYIVVVKTISG